MEQYSTVLVATFSCRAVIGAGRATDAGTAPIRIGGVVLTAAPGRRRRRKQAAAATVAAADAVDG